MGKATLLVTVLTAMMFSASCGDKNNDAVFHVSPTGNDSWSGTVQKADASGKDGPFATLERARDAVREIIATNGVSNGGATIMIHAGTYQLTSSLQLSGEDSGVQSKPVVWRAAPGETVVLSGGKRIDRFEPVSDPAIRSRLSEQAAQKVVQADLKSLGISDYGRIDPAGGNRIELYFKGKFMTIARYPDDGWLTIADVPQTGPKMLNPGLDRDKSPVPRGRHYGRFTYPDNRPAGWKDTSNLWVHGYWTWDWSDQYLKVDHLDIARKEITPAEPHHSYGYTKGQRFYFLNILEELDTPGEWYLDNATGILYFWPPSEPKEGDAMISVAEEPLISMNEASHITIRGLFFEGGRSNAIDANDCSDIMITGCAFRNFGKTAVVIEGGERSGVASSDIYDVAGGGITLHGGDRATLTPAGLFAVNCHIHDYGIRLKTYQPAVEITGVGNRAAHNLIHDAPHTGIFLVTSKMGNNHLIEYNELHSLAKETGDVGAIYLCGRDFTMRGNVVRYNYLHDIKGPGNGGAMAIYLDDFTSGTEVYGNICYRSSRAILLGGGRNNTIENNIFLECDPSVHVDARGIGWAKYYFKDNMRFVELMKAVNYDKPPYSEQYPELLTLIDDDPAMPKYNKVITNISAGGRFLDLYDGLDLDDVEVKNNITADPVVLLWKKDGASEFSRHAIDDAEAVTALEQHGNIVSKDFSGFVDPDKGNFALKDEGNAAKIGFKPIPTESIGLVADEYRNEIPKPY